MKLLLDELTESATVGLLHELAFDDNLAMRRRRRAYKTLDRAKVQYFEYADVMRAIGYEIRTDVNRPWSYDVVRDHVVVERVSIDWS